MPDGVISMPSPKRHETLPERPGESPVRLIVNAVSMTARRALNSLPLMADVSSASRAILPPLSSAAFGVQGQQAFPRSRPYAALGNEASDKTSGCHVECGIATR